MNIIKRLRDFWFVFGRSAEPSCVTATSARIERACGSCGRSITRTAIEVSKNGLGRLESDRRLQPAIPCVSVRGGVDVSSIMRFTPAHPIDYEHVEANRNAHGTGVKILDRRGLEDELSARNETIKEQLDTRSYTDQSGYPREEWDLFLGFTTFGGDEDDAFGGADYHNVSNTSPEDMADIFGLVSEYTEAFVVWMTDWDGHWPHAVEVATGQNDPIYELKATDGDVSATKITFDVSRQEDMKL